MYINLNTYYCKTMPSKTKRTSSLLKKKTKSVKAKSVKAPKKAKAKTPKSSKTPKPNTPKAKTPKAERKSKRKINMNQTLSKKAGLNISVARVKNIIDTFIINREEFVAATEVRHAYHPTEKDKEGKVKELPSVSVSDLSEETQDLIQKASYFYDRSDKEEYERKYISGLSTDAKTKYSDAKKKAKDAYEEEMRLVPEFDRTVFDVEAFNKSFDKKFYKGYVEPETSDDEWQQALSHLSKLRVRFSANSKILLSAFIELLLRQLAINGTFNCIQNKKKIIKLSHALQTNSKTEEHFPLFSLVSNTKAYRRYLTTKVVKETSEDEDGDGDDETPVSVDVEDSSRPNFRFYVSEICRDVRMQLAAGDLSVVDDPTEDKQIYNLTNVSRDFKDFCNSLIFETVSILGRMILTEINTRGVKTLNDVIMKTVIEHMHSAYGIDFTVSLNFIESSTKKYNAFVKKRRESRKTASSDVEDDGYDVEYSEE